MGAKLNMVLQLTIFQNYIQIYFVLFSNMKSLTSKIVIFAAFVFVCVRKQRETTLLYLPEHKSLVRDVSYQLDVVVQV